MEPTFKILSADTFPERTNLFVEINLWGVTFVITAPENVCVAIISYHFPADTSFERAAVYIKQAVAEQDILQFNFGAITIVYAYPAAMLVPNTLMASTTQKEMLELVCGDIYDGYIRTEFSYKHQLNIIFAIPKTTDAVISYLFSTAVVRHQYGLLTDILPLNGNHLFCIFGNGYFTLLLGKNGAVQIVQSFAFKTPEDVAYYVLQLCANYEMPVGEVVLELSGMINEESALYAELYKYFLQIQLQKLPRDFSYPEDMSQIPAHYFSHLLQMILCV